MGVPYGAKSYTIGGSKDIFDLDKKNKWAFIGGVFEGDCLIVFSKYTGLFKISSGSKRFIEDFKELFESLGFNSLRIVSERENIWELKISKQEEIKKIYSSIYEGAQFFYPRKRTKWQKRYI